MKKITLLLLTFISCSIFAQEQGYDSKKLFELVKDISKTKIIYDRVSPVADLTNGSDKTLNSVLYKQAFYQIQRADYLNRLPNLELLEIETEKGFSNNIIPISILISEFEKLKPEVKDQNLLQLNSNNQFVPTSSNFDYFNEYKIGLAAPLIKELKGTTVTFKLDSQLIFNTTQNSIQKIEANFNNQGFQLIQSNKNITIDFGSIGEKEIEFKITLTNGEIYKNKVSFKLKEKAQTLDYSKNISKVAPSTVGP